MRKIIAAILLSGILFGSCKKKDKDPSKTELLQKGKWKLSQANFNGFVNLMDNMKDCQKDNFYFFNADKTMTVDEGATKCNSSSEQTYTDGYWNLVNNDAQISINGSALGFGGTLTGDIVTLSSSTLQIKKDTTVSGFKGTANITFTNVQ
ncbi:MAG TPA: lipocalin family protein [Chitinophagaceae bacterium]|nr:lipocalin family protein [Chitinophagaceae bacterium]